MWVHVQLALLHLFLLWHMFLHGFVDILTINSWWVQLCRIKMHLSDLHLLCFIWLIFVCLHIMWLLYLSTAGEKQLTLHLAFYSKYWLLVFLPIFCWSTCGLSHQLSVSKSWCAKCQLHGPCQFWFSVVWCDMSNLACGSIMVCGSMMAAHGWGLCFARL